MTSLEIEKIRMEAATEDIHILKKSGYIAITGTIYGGPLFLELEGGVFTSTNGKGQTIRCTEDETSFLSHIASAYRVEIA